MENIGKDKSIRILIADGQYKDVQAAQKEIRNTFQASVFMLTGNGEKFLHELKTFQPDIVISEYCSLNINGIAILNIIQEHAPQVPVIILTSEINEDEALDCIEKGAADYVLKENIKRLGFTVTNALRIKAAKVELQHSENDIVEYEKYIQKYRRWEKNIPGMVYQFVLHHNGKFSFIYVSSASKTLFGVEPEIIVRDINSIDNMMHPDDVAGMQKAIGHSAITLKTFKHEARFIINGKLRWYRFISKPGLQENGDIIWDGFMIDNTENKHLEEELEQERAQIHTLFTALQNFNENPESVTDEITDKLNYSSPYLAGALFDQNQYKILMDNLPDAIYFKDLESRFIRVNKYFAIKVGEFSEISVLGKTDLDFFDSAHANEARFDELEIIRTGNPVVNKIEKEVWPSGKVTWVSTTKMALRDIKGNIIGTFGMSRDISKSKRMEETLAQERNLMREIIDAIPDRIYVKDTNCNFVLNNIADLTALGIKTQQDIIGKNDFNFLPNELAVKFYEEDKNVISTGQSILNKEESVEVVSGKLRWYITTKVALCDIHGETTGMVGISRDITKRKEIESALIASETQLTNALKIAHLAYWEYDIVNDIFTFNDQFYALLRTSAKTEGGYQMPSAQYTGRFVYHEDKPLIGSEIQKAIATKDPGYSNQLEHRIIYANGEIGYFSTRFFIIKNDAGQTVKAYGTNQDVTKRRRAEEALRASEYFLRKSQFIAHLGSYSLDLKTGIWESSVTIDEIFGINENYVKNIEGWLDIVHPDEKEEIREYFGKKIISEHCRFEKEYRIIRQNDSQERWVFSLGDLEFDSEGTPLRLIGTIQDVTERVIREKEKHELEEQLRLRNKKLEKTLLNLKQMQGTLVQSEKMASLGQLTAGIAHEINNPLAFVSSNINRLKEYFQDTVTLLNKWRELGAALKNEKHFDEEIESIEAYAREIDLNFILLDFGSMMQSISEGTQRIKKIVEGLRGFAHMADSSFSKASVNQAIDDTLTIVWNELKYKAMIEKEYADLPLVTCNIGEIKQVLVNLLVNAAHSIKEKGIINISTLTDGEWVLVNIRDTGCGIAKENLKRIFDPFFTTKEIGKGTGLGLWVSSSIIEKHGGLLTVESTVGTGSTFTIKLPVEQRLSNLKRKD